MAGQLLIGKAAKRRLAQLKHHHVKVAWSRKDNRFFVRLMPLKGKPRLGWLAKRQLKKMKGDDLLLAWSPKRGLFVRRVKAPKPKPSRRMEAVAYARESLKYAGLMIYTEGPGRSSLFNRPPGEFMGAAADCSQFVSAIMHWCGVTSVNQYDATGTLLAKGRQVDEPAYGRIVVFGPGAGVHAGMFTRHDGGWYLTEFGHPGAPDEISLSASIAYFQQRGEPGVRYLDFF